MNTDYFENEAKYTWPFYIILGLLAIFTLMGFGIDYDEYSQYQSLHIPKEYFFIIFTVDLSLILLLVMILFFKKWGLFLFPFMVITHFFLHQFYLNTFLYTDVTNLFLYIGIGLAIFIPKWKYFK